jgi:hypothetical protein
MTDIPTPAEMAAELGRLHQRLDRVEAALPPKGLASEAPDLRHFNQHGYDAPPGFTRADYDEARALIGYADRRLDGWASDVAAGIARALAARSRGCGAVRPA